MLVVRFEVGVGGDDDGFSADGIIIRLLLSVLLVTFCSGFYILLVIRSTLTLKIT